MQTDTHHFRPRSRLRGITLIELLATVAIVAAVASFAIPSAQVSIANHRQTSIVNRFVASVLLARSLAITHGREAILCPSVDGLTCHDQNDWHSGWLVVLAPDPATGADPASARVVRSEAGSALTYVQSNRVQFRFRPRGLRATNGTVTVCVPHASHPKAVIVSYNGRPRTSRVLASGEAIECGPW